MEFRAVDTIKHEVLAEKSGFDHETQSAGPEVEINGAHHVNCLIRPAVMFAIADGIADDTFGIHHDRPLHGMLEDARLRRLSRQAFCLAPAYRLYFHGLPFVLHDSRFPIYAVESAHGKTSHRSRN
ncbi:hypothetical protein D3C78_923860 [compost metagenome]